MNAFAVIVMELLKIANDGVIRSAEKGKGPSTKDVRQMGRGVVLKFRTFPDGGRGGVVCESSDVPKISENIEIPKFLRAV